MTRLNRNICRIVTTTAAVAVLAYIGIATKRWLDPYDGRDFDRVVWHADPGGHDRAAMCTDIIERHLRPGMTFDRITDLLGQSFWERDRSHLADGEQMAVVRAVSYSVGSCSWIGYDDAFLYVNLDADDKLVSATVYGY